MKSLLLSLMLMGHAATAAQPMLFDRWNFANALETAYRAKVVSMSKLYPRQKDSNDFTVVSVVVELKLIRDDETYELDCYRAKQTYSEAKGYQYILDDCEVSFKGHQKITPAESQAREFPTRKTPLDLQELMQRHPYGPS